MPEAKPPLIFSVPKPVHLLFGFILRGFHPTHVRFSVIAIENVVYKNLHLHINASSPSKIFSAVNFSLLCLKAGDGNENGP